MRHMKRKAVRRYKRRRWYDEDEAYFILGGIEAGPTDKEGV